MRRGILGSIAAMAAGAGTAWGQSPAPLSPAGDPPPPAAVAPAGDVIPVQAQGQAGIPGPVNPGGIAGLLRPAPPAPVIMPPIGPGPTGDPQGLGPVAGMGPPPGPMWPPPGPYSAPQFQPAPPNTGNSPVGQAPHWWFQGDYLLYFQKSQSYPFPMVTTSAPSDQGLLGRPSTLVLVGNKDVNLDIFSGFRLSGGFYGDADRRYGVEASGFLTERKALVQSFYSSPSGIPTLARPFIDTAGPGTYTSLVFASPKLGQGGIRVSSSSLTYSVEGNGILNVYRSEPFEKHAWSLDLLAGYRYFELQEDFQVSTNTQLNLPNTTTPMFAVGPLGTLVQTGSMTTAGSQQFGQVAVFNPASIVTNDYYQVRNRFNGGQVGFRAEVRYGMFTLTSTNKIAFGDMNERLDIRGSSGFVDPTRSTYGTAFGGLMANANNIGRYNYDQFAVIPEFNINAGLNITRGLTAFVGYNFLYVSRVARPLDQVNPVVDTSTVPYSPNYGATNRPPGFQQYFTQTDYWLMGINFGAMLRY